MLKHSVRISVALLTFAIGIALIWPVKIIQRLETALVDRFYDVGDNVLNPISLTDDPAEQANEIYRLLIHKKFPFNGQGKLIVLKSESATHETYVHPFFISERRHPEKFKEMLEAEMPAAEMQTLDNYILRNTAPEQLKVWNLGINCVMATKSDLSEDRPDKFWINFNKKYPNSAGLVSFSLVGFNDRHDQALVYTASSCGYTCGSGAYILLKKVNGKWEIQDEGGTWIS